MKTVLVYSGGLDSTVLLYDLMARGMEVLALTVDYGQRHRREVESAVKIAKKLEVEHLVAQLGNMRELMAGSSQTSGASVPDGHYNDRAMQATVVPNRTMVLLALAAAWAVSRGADTVAYAAHSGDHTIYPDCRPEFVQAMREAIFVAGGNSITLFAPFLGMNKTEIVKLGMRHDVPFSLTWSCYKGGKKHCGKCGVCVERREAFNLAGMKDPTPYDEPARVAKRGR